MKTKKLLSAIALWLAGAGLALAQSNSLEGFDVSEQAGKVVVRITTKDPLGAVPPNFAVANPARIALDLPNTVNALVRSTHSPPLSCTSSLRLICASSIPVITPKFWPM